mmetsp:Transcript_125202/g.216974  ORF Transcript_125202/g.216974 Transcript_125202/m.216974 type:complete len:233 (+) Transcript_125202:690-1388(+)
MDIRLEPVLAMLLGVYSRRWERSARAVDSSMPKCTRAISSSLSRSSSEFSSSAAAAARAASACTFACASACSTSACARASSRAHTTPPSASTWARASRSWARTSSNFSRRAFSSSSRLIRATSPLAIISSALPGRPPLCETGVGMAMASIHAFDTRPHFTWTAWKTASSSSIMSSLDPVSCCSRRARSCTRTIVRMRWWRSVTGSDCVVRTHFWIRVANSSPAGPTQPTNWT